MGSQEWLSWGPPTYSNEISTSDASKLSYKTIKVAYEYLSSAAQDTVYIAPTKESMTFDWLSAVSDSLGATIPRQPPVPVMPEQLT